MEIYITKAHVTLENKVANFQLTDIFHVSTQNFEQIKYVELFFFCRWNFHLLKLETFSYAVHLLWNFFLLKVKHFLFEKRNILYLSWNLSEVHMELLHKDETVFTN
jgi:hypothetical protein